MDKPRNHGQPWTKEDDERLHLNMCSGEYTDETVEHLAERLGRTPVAIRARLKGLGYGIAKRATDGDQQVNNHMMDAARYWSSAELKYNAIDEKAKEQEKMMKEDGIYTFREYVFGECVSDMSTDRLIDTITRLKDLLTERESVLEDNAPNYLERQREQARDALAAMHAELDGR